jgi:phosphatidylserine/phosphatidylglycerophosphate/cardiolipin synthase-like enzyme
MPAFHTPIATPSAWTLTSTGPVTIPDGLRYAGYSAPGVRATIGLSEDVLVPATGVLRQVVSGTDVFVEVQVNPFPIRTVVTELPGGLPTFYLVFPDALGLTFAEGDGAAGGELLRPGTDVTIVAIRQDRIMRDPALWSAQIESAVVAGSGDATPWQPFATEVAAALTSGDASPVYVYDHDGSPHTSATVEVLFGTTAPGGGHTIAMEPVDGGDLQRAVARLNAAPGSPVPIANLWGGGAASFRLRPALGSARLVRLEDGLAAETEIEVTRTERSVMLTDLDAWFADQTATPPGASLSRYTTGNVFTPQVNGPEFLDDLCLALRDAQDANGGFHLAGWSMFPRTQLTRLPMRHDPHTTLDLDQAMAAIGADNVPLTLEQAVKLIGDAGGACRFLPAEFIQVLPGENLSATQTLVMHALISGILIFNSFGFDFARTDAAGAVAMIVLWAGVTFYVSMILSEDGDPVEPNKDALKILNAATNPAIANSVAALAPYPARIEDNDPPPDLTNFPISFLADSIRNFGIFHQKFALVKTASGMIGYAGGVDVNPNRIDDVDHLARSPYHDVHARIDGNAVGDLAISFDERWANEGTGGSAFPPPAFDPTLSPGTDVVQVARTYFAPEVGTPGRALPYAPDGDRTIADTMLAAIAEAKEYIYVEDQYLSPPQVYWDALVAKVALREVRQVIIVNAGAADQPFGDIARQGFVTDLLAADAGAGIVRVGYPRRRFTSTDNDLRADSGKLLLMADLPAAAGGLPTIFLGPPSRIPAVPYWVCVGGEMIYVYDESTLPNPEPESMRGFTCERGPSTHFVRGGATPVGTRTREHARGAPATVVDVSNIYVHAKLMIVDDVFVGIGSANLNNRGLFYDGEINLFSMPESLRHSPRNPALQLRRRLWAEMMDFPEAMVTPLLGEPLASAPLLDRSPFAGNRFLPLDAQPPHLMLGWTTGDGAFMTILQLLGFSIVAADQPALYEHIVDPKSRTA